MRTRALSPRQYEVARLTAQGLSDRDIATRLRISYATVKTHQAAIRLCLGVREREHYAAALAKP